MLVKDLAELYGVETRSLIQAVKRNIERFPPDFMLQLTKEEFDSLRSQIVISKQKRVLHRQPDRQGRVRHAGASWHLHKMRRRCGTGYRKRMKLTSIWGKHISPAGPKMFVQL